MSEVKVNKISPRTACGTVTLGDSGDTFTIPSGATINNQGTAVNFGATGSASWVTTVKTSSPFTAVAGEGYFVNTTSGPITVNLPAGTAGDVVAIKDYANTFDTNAVTLVRNGSDKIGGVAIDATLSTEGLAVTLVFVDSTQGWLVTDSGLQSEAPSPQFVTASGGTETTSPCGNFKVHTFTGPGTFCVSGVGNDAGSTTIDYLVVAGGGGGGIGTGNTYASGGGGAGGMRFSFPNPAIGGTPVSVQGYPIVVGGGGGQAGENTNGNNGLDSVAFSITSTGGGGGASGPGNQGAENGGSGGGSGYSGQGGGTGNTPPVSPSQGNNGGTSNSSGPNSPGVNAGGGGGGHAGVGEPNAAYPNQEGGAGGAGTPLTIGDSPALPGGRAYAGGGAGSQAQPAQNAGVPGGGGAGRPNCSTARNGVDNTGGGGSGGFPASYGSGGSGVVIIRYKFQ